MLADSRALNPELRASPGRHAHGAPRPAIRRGLRARRNLLHDDGIGPSRQAIETAFRSLQARWRRAVCPGLRAREFPRRGTDHGGHDAGARGMRWVEWTWDPDPGPTTAYVVDYAYLLASPTARCTSSTIDTSKACFLERTWLRLDPGRRVPADSACPSEFRLELDTQTLEIFVCT